TASWGPGYGVDAFTMLQTGYHIANEGTVMIEGDSRVPPPWMVQLSEVRSVGVAPPGASLLVAPVYVVWPGAQSEIPRSDHGGIRRASPGGPRGEGTLLVPPFGPGALLASLTTAVAMGLLAVIFLTFGGGWAAVVGGLIAGLGTAAWSIAAHYYWQHGPAMMWLASGMYLSASHQVWAGAAFGAAGLTRPHTLVIAAATGIGRSIGERRWKPALLIGMGSLIGLLVLLLYQKQVFGSWSLFYGVDPEYSGRATSLDFGWYGRNLLNALFHPQKGLLIYAPFLLVLIPGIAAAWRAAPSWVRGSALGGLVYLLVQYKLRTFNDESTAFGYRYPLEAMIALAPLLFLSYTEWVRKRRLARWAFAVAVAFSIAFQFTGAIESF
ncbi:MAG: hypothetical protein M3132_07625, partial [Actinomycetia bacterium]|nr:hypothetical protein [Actinomycetes bacterium]